MSVSYNTFISNYGITDSHTQGPKTSYFNTLYVPDAYGKNIGIKSQDECEYSCLNNINCNSYSVSFPLGTQNRNYHNKYNCTIKENGVKYNSQMFIYSPNNEKINEHRGSYYKNMSDNELNYFLKTNWGNPVPGQQLKQIDVNGNIVSGIKPNIVCGLNSANNIFCSDSDIIDWKEIGGSLNYISVGDKTLYGLSSNSSKNIYTKNRFGNPILTPVGQLQQNSWKNINGGLTQIHSSGNKVCGVNSNDNIFCATVKTDNSDITFLNWYQIQGALIYVHVNNNYLYGINRQGQLWRINTDIKISVNDRKLFNGPIGETLTKVSVNDGKIYVLANNGNIYGMTLNKLDLNNPLYWLKVPGNLKHISVKNDGKLYGVNSNGQIFITKPSY
jgi:hypothetical protein